MLADANHKHLISDGPYVFKKGDRWLIRWVEKGEARKKHLSADELINFVSWDSRYFDPACLLSAKKDPDRNHQFDNVSQIAVISDVHGQYDQMLKLLTAHGVVDDRFNWKMGEGHLVILGDVLDRGNQVQQCLWLLFKLEQQAGKAGGRLHFVLGNHEVMILDGDLRYVHKMYEDVAQILRTPYNELFGKHAVLGKWLGTKPALIGINDFLFVHAGISPEVMKAGFTAKEINNEFLTRFAGQPRQHRSMTKSRSNILHGVHGPVWYRGHVYDAAFSAFDQERILKYLEKNVMIAGHTTMPRIEPLFEGRLYIVDTGIKYGDRGEILLIENGVLFAGDSEGKRRQL